MSDRTNAARTDKESEAYQGRWLARIAVAFCIVVIAFAMVIMALDFGTEARRLPLVVGVPLLFISLINLAVDILQAIRARRGFDVESSGEKASASIINKMEELRERSEVGDVPQEVEAAADADSGIPIWGALATVATLMILYLALGQVLVAPIFVVFMMRVIGKQPWLHVLMATMFLALVMYTLTGVLGVQAHSGWIPDRFGWSWV